MGFVVFLLVYKKKKGEKENMLVFKRRNWFASHDLSDEIASVASLYYKESEYPGGLYVLYISVTLRRV